MSGKYNTAVPDNQTFTYNQTALTPKTMDKIFMDLYEKYGPKAQIQITGQTATTFTVTVYKSILS